MSMTLLWRQICFFLSLKNFIFSSALTLVYVLFYTKSLELPVNTSWPSSINLFRAHRSPHRGEDLCKIVQRPSTWKKLEIPPDKPPLLHEDDNCINDASFLTRKISKNEKYFFRRHKIKILRHKHCSRWLLNRHSPDFDIKIAGEALILVSKSTKFFGYTVWKKLL